MFQILTTSKTSNVPIWPSLKTKEFAFPPTTAAGGPSRVSASVSTLSNNKYTNKFDSDNDDDEYNEDYARPVAVSSDSFGSAIAEALYQNASSNNNSNKATHGGKGKKKNRNTVLFSMGGRTFDGN